MHFLMYTFSSHVMALYNVTPIDLLTQVAVSLGDNRRFYSASTVFVNSMAKAAGFVQRRYFFNSPIVISLSSYLYNSLTKLGVQIKPSEPLPMLQVQKKWQLRQIVALKSEFKAEIAKVKIELKYMRWVLGLIFVMNVAILIKLLS